MRIIVATVAVVSVLLLGACAHKCPYKQNYCQR